MFCDFCECDACKTGRQEIIMESDPNTVIGIMPLYHTQCEDGRWICEICYNYECCVDAKSDPCEGKCGEHKCNHRPKLVNNEWTFWRFNF